MKNDSFIQDMIVDDAYLLLKYLRKYGQQTTLKQQRECINFILQSFFVVKFNQQEFKFFQKHLKNIKRTPRTQLRAKNRIIKEFMFGDNQNLFQLREKMEGLLSSTIKEEIQHNKWDFLRNNFKNYVKEKYGNNENQICKYLNFTWNKNQFRLLNPQDQDILPEFLTELLSEISEKKKGAKKQYYLKFLQSQLIKYHQRGKNYKSK